MGDDPRSAKIIIIIMIIRNSLKIEKGGPKGSDESGLIKVVAIGNCMYALLHMRRIRILQRASEKLVDLLKKGQQ